MCFLTTAKTDNAVTTLDGKTILRGGRLRRVSANGGVEKADDDIGNEADNEFDETELGITDGSDLASGTFTR